MKLKNHNKNNHYNLENGFSMHGTIEMTAKEYAKVIMYIANMYTKASKNCETYTRDTLSKALHNHDTEYMQAKANIFSIGITANKLIAKKYKLNNYKDQNYAIKIIN